MSDSDTDSDVSALMQLQLLADMMSDDDADDEEEEMRRTLLLSGGILMALLKDNWKCRICKLATKRVGWKEHADTLAYRNEFGSKYTMEQATFNDLVELLRDNITFDEMKSRNSTAGVEPIFPELVLGMTMRLVAGGREQDIQDWAGVSRSSFFRSRDNLFFAVVNCDDLRFSFPCDDRNKLDALAHWFARKSNPGGEPVFFRCVGSIDGTIIRIISPAGVANKKCYFSGHYHCMGLNVQAICDSHSRFLYFEVAAPGGTPDIVAMRDVQLDKTIDALPAGYYVVGDNAYPLSEQILIPYSGQHRADPAKDVFNFYLSQLRIRIEMAFGLFTTKFRIFRKPLQVSIPTANIMLQVCARLHNFIINKQRPPDGGDYNFEIAEYPREEIHADSEMTEAERIRGFIPGEPPSAEDLEVDNEILPPLQSLQGMSLIRDEITKRVVAMGLERPKNNRERSEKEDNSE